MTLNKLASLIAKREGLKVQIGIAQVREVLRILLDLEQELPPEDSPTAALMTASAKRAIKPRRKKAR